MEVTYAIYNDKLINYGDQKPPLNKAEPNNR